MMDKIPALSFGQPAIKGHVKVELFDAKRGGTTRMKRSIKSVMITAMAAMVVLSQTTTSHAYDLSGSIVNPIAKIKFQFILRITCYISVFLI